MEKYESYGGMTGTTVLVEVRDKEIRSVVISFSLFLSRWRSTTPVKVLRRV